MEKMIATLACLFLLGIIGDATEADNDKIWEKLKEVEERNEKLERELHAKSSYILHMGSMLQGAMNDIHELKAARSEREICKHY